ncbi:MAG: Gfo/Idh/MocA family oxidoreductase [Acidobacteria bacterium]|nr:Gfo/Idh/MocA family oxidoreductase [Acidobacteriota bacterium]
MNTPDRRRFLAGAIATAASYQRILGANERIQVGAIGTGSRCQYLLSLLNQCGGNDITAVCDVYGPRRAAAKSKYAPEAKESVDFREVLDRKDIDAVVVGTPDHWHVPVTIAAVRAGKDVYCEKPVTHTIEESEPLIAAVKDSGRVVQTGTQQRSWAHYAQAKQLVDSGALGRITLVRTYWYQNHVANQDSGPAVDTSALDWKQFLGSAKDRPFDADQFLHWRWYWDFGGGAMTDLFVHWVDVAHWFLGEDMPQRATATGTRAILKQRQTPDTMSAALTYPSAVVEFDSALLGYIEGGGLMFRGTKGAMRLHRSGFTMWNEIPRYSENFEPDAAEMQVKSKGDGTLDHMKNFLDCVRTRKTPNASVEIGVAAARAGHAANFALRGSGVWNLA